MTDEAIHSLLDRLDEIGLKGIDNPLRLRAIESIIEYGCPVWTYDNPPPNESGFVCKLPTVPFQEILFLLGATP